MHILRVLFNETKHKDTVGSTQLNSKIIGMIDGRKSTTIPHWDSLEDIDRGYKKMTLIHLFPFDLI